MNYLGQNVQDAHIISESLNDGENAVIDFIARQVQNITKNSPGFWITESLSLADLARDKNALRAVYKQNEQVVNQYFDQVDIEKVVKAMGPEFQEQLKLTWSERAKNNLPGLAIGFTAAMLLSALRRR